MDERVSEKGPGDSNPLALGTVPWNLQVTNRGVTKPSHKKFLQMNPFPGDNILQSSQLRKYYKVGLEGWSKCS